MLTVEEWQWIRDEIVKDFPNLTIGELDLIISNGVKGYYDNSKYPININATTIFRWIKKYLNIADGWLGEWNPEFSHITLHKKK